MIKPLLVALLALAGPLQAELTFVCTAMEDGMPGSCCEHHGDGDGAAGECDTPFASTTAECMEPAVTADSYPSARSKPTVQSHDCRGPPVVAPSPPDLSAAPASAARPRDAWPAARMGGGTDVWLLTLRLRL